MPELIANIKDLAHKASEDYLLFGKNMNNALVEMVQNGDIENNEILKRICEQANQNVYLSLFHDPDTNKSNITFDMANFEEIIKNTEESEEAMKDFNTPPEDFRSSLEVAIAPSVKDESSKEAEKTADLNTAVEYRQVLRNFLNKVEMMKTAECDIAEKNFNLMAHDARSFVAEGESIGDISKIATRYVKENLEGDFVKIAKCYDIIHKDLVDSNFHVRTGFTKLSSQRINDKSSMIKPVHEFSMSIAKIAGLRDMEINIRTKLNIFDKNIKQSHSEAYE